MISKNRSTIIISIILILSMISGFTSAEVEAYESQDANTEMGAFFSETYLEIGDTFNATIYLQAGGVDQVTTWKIYNLTYNDDSVGIVNATNTRIFGFWDTGFDDTGTIHNDTGNITNIQSFDTSGSTANHTACAIDFIALKPGQLTLKFSNYQDYNFGVKMEKSGPTNVVNHTVNANINIYPQDPTSLTATTWNHTAINLSWGKGEGDDRITVCGKAGSYPTGPSDSLIYNGTNDAYNHTALNNCTAYYYRAWGWNTSAEMHSYEYQSATATTSCYTNISITGSVPTNDTQKANCTYTQTVNTTIINSKGTTCLYWINASNGQTSSGSVLNNSVSLALTGLSHNTTYWWNVTASEPSTGDSTQAHYHFKTGQGGGSSPTGSNAYPNGLTNIPISPNTFAATSTDTDGDPINVSFFWANNSFIGNHNMTYSGNTANVTHNSYPLSYNTTYQWYTLLNDTSGCSTSVRYPSSGYFSFTTQNQQATLSKEWTIHTNNTLQFWINTTNVGEADLTNGYINETWDYDYLTLVGANWTADGTDSGRYNISSLPTANTASLTMFFSLRAPLPNGTTLSDTASVYFNGTQLNTFTPSTLPTMCYYATKESNTSIRWNTSSVQYWINVTNCGDFYLNWTQVNETYPSNLTYSWSNYPPSGDNLTFNITQIAPGSSNTTIIQMTKTAPDWINGSRVWNNITIHSNQTTGNTGFNNSWYVGARTTEIRVTYNTIYYDILGTSNSIFQILGVVLIVGALLGVIYVFYLNKQQEW